MGGREHGRVVGGSMGGWWEEVGGREAGRGGRKVEEDDSMKVGVGVHGVGVGEWGRGQ